MSPNIRRSSQLGKLCVYYRIRIALALSLPSTLAHTVLGPLCCDSRHSPKTLIPALIDILPIFPTLPTASAIPRPPSSPTTDN